MKDIILVCEDLFGLEVFSILMDLNRWHEQRNPEKAYRILGYISDVEKPFGELAADLIRLGSLREWKPIGKEKYVLGIRIPERKKYAVSKLKEAGCQFETVSAPWTLGYPVSLGEGSVFIPYTVTGEMKTGKFVTAIDAILTGHYVDDFSSVLHFSNIIGPVGKETYVGNHVYLHHGKTIGDHCYVSDGSVVIQNVKSGTAVAGVPARKISFGKEKAE